MLTFGRGNPPFENITVQSFIDGSVRVQKRQLGGQIVDDILFNPSEWSEIQGRVAFEQRVLIGAVADGLPVTATTSAEDVTLLAAQKRQKAERDAALVVEQTALSEAQDAAHDAQVAAAAQITEEQEVALKAGLIAADIRTALSNAPPVDGAPADALRFHAPANASRTVWLAVSAIHIEGADGLTVFFDLPESENAIAFTIDFASSAGTPPADPPAAPPAPPAPSGDPPPAPGDPTPPPPTPPPTPPPVPPVVPPL